MMLYYSNNCDQNAKISSVLRGESLRRKISSLVLLSEHVQEVLN